MVPHASSSRSALRYVAYATLSIVGSLVASCSSDSAPSTDSPTTAATDASGSAPPSSMQTSAQPQAGSSATPTTNTGMTKPMTMSMTPTTPAMGGDVPPPSGQAGSGSMTTDKPNEPPPKKDCTPVTWDNPGKVAGVTLKEIPPDAGEHMRPFESINPLKDYDYEWKEFLFTSTSPACTSRLM